MARMKKVGKKKPWKLIIGILVVLFLFGSAGSDEEAAAPVESPVASASVTTPAPTPEATPAPTPKPTTAPTVAPTEEPEESAEIPADSSFAVHFIDVGQADAALVLCDGKSMLIDGGNSADSSLIYSYLKNHNVSHLDYIVATHAHEDHVGGLSGALNYATVGTAFCSVTEYDSKTFNDFVKYLDKQNVSITVPSAGDSFKLGSANVQILAPITHSDDPNNMSIVLRVVYGGTSFLFTGDAEREEEQDILNAGFNLDSTVLKVGHHGSDTSTTYPFLREIMPEYGVISVGEGNSYGHPTEDTLSRLRDADVKVFRTDMQGTIICTSDGNTVSFNVGRNKDANTLELESTPTPEPTPEPTPTVAPVPESTSKPSPDTEPTPEPKPVGQDYVLNTNSHKFHYPSCGSAKKTADHNKAYFTGTRDELIARGYSPCGNCHP